MISFDNCLETPIEPDENVKRKIRNLAEQYLTFKEELTTKYIGMLEVSNITQNNERYEKYLSDISNLIGKHIDACIHNLEFINDEGDYNRAEEAFEDNANTIEQDLEKEWNKMKL